MNAVHNMICDVRLTLCKGKEGGREEGRKRGGKRKGGEKRGGKGGGKEGRIYIKKLTL